MHDYASSSRTRSRPSLKSAIKTPGLALELARSARDLLCAGLSAKEVASRLGFAHPSSFTRFFKSKTGVVPRAVKGTKFDDGAADFSI